VRHTPLQVRSHDERPHRRCTTSWSDRCRQAAD
jgi:hypothetical protein